MNKTVSYTILKVIYLLNKYYNHGNNSEHDTGLTSGLSANENLYH